MNVSGSTKVSFEAGMYFARSFCFSSGISSLNVTCVNSSISYLSASVFDQWSYVSLSKYESSDVDTM